LPFESSILVQYWLRNVRFSVQTEIHLSQAEEVRST